MVEMLMLYIHHQLLVQAISIEELLNNQFNKEDLMNLTLQEEM
jgi:hypothetical protein